MLWPLDFGDKTTWGAVLRETVSSLSGRWLDRAGVEATKRALFGFLRGEFDDSVVAKALTVKVVNLLLAKRYFLARSERVGSRPLGLVIDPSNGCNLSCPGCVHSAGVQEQALFRWDKGLLSERRLAAVLRQYGPSALHINFYNY